MRHAVLMLLTAFTLLALAQVSALLADAPAEPSTVSGQFVKWQGPDLALLVEKSGSLQEVTYKVADSAIINLNGKTAARTDLKENMAVTLTITGYQVTRIEASGAASKAKKDKQHEKDDDDD